MVKLLRSGKVRDIYARQDEIWLVASDRISAYDVIMPTLIPDKGKILTSLSRHWFTLTAPLCPNHVLGYDVPAGVDQPEFAGRLTRARRVEIFPIECVARGYLAGSGWEEYREQRNQSAAISCPPVSSNRRDCPSRSSPLRAKTITATTKT